MSIEQNASYEIQRLFDRMHRLQSSRPAPELARRKFVTLHVLGKLCAERGGGIQMSALARELEISLPAVSKTIQSLEERGYALREADPTSRRNTLVRPTEKGVQLEKTVGCCKEARTQRIFDRLGERDAAEFFRICTRLIQIAEEEQREEREKSND